MADSSEIDKDYKYSMIRLYESFLPYVVSLANIESLSDKIKSYAYDENNQIID